MDRSQVRDRTLVLRILVPSLQTRLRDKMAALEEEAASKASEAAVASADADRGGVYSSLASGAAPVASKEGQVLDLQGVSCEPTSTSTLWNFHCDGATYPARLVNLPCPVELHKTYDHATYYKCADVGQLLIVYEDYQSLEEAESVTGFKTEGFPSYYHSGLTPPMRRVVERRFAAREHSSVPPDHFGGEVSEVENELLQLIESTNKDAAKTKPGGTKTTKAAAAAAAAASSTNKIMEEVVEDVVDYEPWMDDNGRQPYGVEFDEKDLMCTKHPEVWLDPSDEEQALKEAERAAEEKRREEANAAAVRAQKKKDAAKKTDIVPAVTKQPFSTVTTTTPTATTVVTTLFDDLEVNNKKEKGKKDNSNGKKRMKKKMKKKMVDDEALSTLSSSTTKRGIAAKKTREHLDEVTQAASQIANNVEDDFLFDDDMFDFAGEDDFQDIDIP